MFSKRLGVNVDHVATLRQARGTSYPDPVFAALLAERIGAHQITIHLREDRRHIQERDLEVLRQVVQTSLNLEMATAEEVVEIACRVKPDRATLVPEKREELTTEGGLDVVRHLARVKGVTARLHGAGIVVSLFIEPDRAQVDAAVAAEADAVEFHTGAYANARNALIQAGLLAQLEDAARYASRMGLEVAAGHGLDIDNVGAVAAIPEVEELNIGHSIISRAIVHGIEKAVSEMLERI